MRQKHQHIEALQYKCEPDNEQWKRIYIDGKPINFDVSDLGRIRNRKTGRIKSQQTSDSGYKIVFLYLPHRKKMRLHLVAGLVARAFLGPRNGKQIDHIDADKTNNRVTNLEFVTQSQNIKRRYEQNPDSKCGGLKYLSAKTYRLIRRLWKKGKHSQCQLGRAFGLHNSTISKIVNHVYEPHPRAHVDLEPDWSQLDPRGLPRQDAA